MAPIQNESLRHLNMGSAPAMATKLINADSLRAEFENGLKRKAFCDFLAIGESTLSTWLQSDRIPQSAALAYGLLKASQTLSAKLDQYENAVEVVENGKAFDLIAPKSPGGRFRRVVVSGIDDPDIALAEAEKRSPWVVNAVAGAEQTMLDRVEHEGDFFSEAAEQLAEIRLLLSDPKAWRQRYQPTADEIAADLA